MSQQSFQITSEVAPIGKELRERQESFLHTLKKFNALTAELIGDAAEINRLVLLAKTKLDGQLKFSVWLNSHVPNLEAKQAEKFSRIADEGLSTARECLFILLPPAERKSVSEFPRTKPSAWEIQWGHAQKLSNALRAAGKPVPPELLKLCGDEIKKPRRK